MRRYQRKRLRKTNEDNNAEIEKMRQEGQAERLGLGRRRR